MSMLHYLVAFSAQLPMPTAFDGSAIKGGRPAAPFADEIADLRSGLTDLDSRFNALAHRVGKDTALPFALTVSATAIYQSLDRAVGPEDFLTGSMDFVLEATPWDDGVFHVDLEASGGDGLDGVVESFGGFNEDAGSLQSDDGLDRLHVREAHVSTPIHWSDLSATIGKVDLTGFFDPNAVANDETSQFLYGGFVNSAAFGAPEPSPAVVLTYEPSGKLDVNLAVASAGNDGDGATSELFSALQLGVFPEIAGAPCEFHATTWRDGSRDDLSGLGISASAELSGGFSLFGRFASLESDGKFPAGIATAFSAGAQWIDPVWAGSSVGLAFGEAKSVDSTLETETAWELYLRNQVNDNLRCSLHMQALDHPAGDPAEDGLFAIALKIQLDV